MPCATDRAGKSRSLLKGRRNTVLREKNLKKCDSLEMTDALSRLLTRSICFVGGISLLCFYSMF